MRIIISSLGSRGDLQPYLALALALQRAGHTVTLATSHNFTAWIQSQGVGVHPTRFSVQEFMRLPETKAALRSRNPVRQFRMAREIMRRSTGAQDDCWRAVQGADFVIQSGTGLGALEAAALLKIPAAFAYLLPFTATRAFPSFFLPLPGTLGGAFNLFTHRLAHQMLWSMIGGPQTNDWRKRLGLPVWRSYAEMFAYGRRLNTPMLYGISPAVLPKPADWDDDQHVTGYWFLDPPADWQPPAELVRFLEAGPPPVYVGFGSMNHENPEKHTRLALRALELSGQRGLLLTGWGGLERQTTPANVFFVDEVPHAWLFPRTAAVVHHGGAGTTSAGLRAGVPSLITPFLGDQIAWAGRVANLEVGPHLPGIKGLTAEKLAAAIHTAVTDPGMRARAAALGDKVRAEDGLGRAVELIERHAAAFRSKTR